MKIPLLALLIIAGVHSAEAQNQKTISNPKKNLVVVGTIDSIHSKILKEQRKIWIHVPASAGDTAAKKKYPVVYLLDGDTHFTSVVGMIDMLSSVYGNTYCPEMIVVGIPNTNRKKDLTPTAVKSGLWVDNNTITYSGGGETFMAFIEKELIPHIDSLYPTTSYRTMIGHSLGGLMVVNALVHHRNLFRSYVAIDPSMWWDREKLLIETAQALKTNSFAGTSMFLAMANTLPREMDTAKAQRDTSESTIHLRSIQRLNKEIMNNRSNGLHASFKYYEDDTHSSVPLIATYDALHFLFNDYRLIFQDSYFNDPSFDMASFLTTHYANISAKYGIKSPNGSTLPPPEDVASGAAYQAREKKQFKNAEALYKMNVRNFPASAGALSSLGDLYADMGDRKSAIANYKKSLSIKENDETSRKLKKLEKH